MADDDPEADPASPGPDGAAEPERYYLRGDHRPADAGETGPLFAGLTEHGGSDGTQAGLIAGDRLAPVLVAGVGYPLLGDLSLGTIVAHRVAEWDLHRVAVADCSHTPVAAYQTITAGDYEHVLLVGAENVGSDPNDGRPSADPGRIHEYDPRDIEMRDDRLADLVGQGAMGLNTLENVIVVTRALGEFPADAHVVAAEPGYDSWGMNADEFTDPVEAALDDVLARVRHYVDDALAGD